MPFDQAGFVVRELTAGERRALDVLRRAREGLASRGGWCKDEYDGVGGYAHCAVGWVREAARSDCIGDRIAGQYLVPELPNGRASWADDHSAILAFNDSLRTRKADVVALFDRAIAKLEGVA